MLGPRALLPSGVQFDAPNMHNWRDNFHAAIAGRGTSLDECDLGANVNFFLHAPVTREDKIDFAQGISVPGKYVEIRANIDVIALISACP
jgi:uncharacterized protein YcgI (DUF1989 family)